MASLREIKQKRDSIQSINKITKAMELVATSKAKRSLNQLLVYRIYYSEMMDTIARIVNYIKQNTSQKKTYWIVIGSDLGLAGGYNSNIIRLANQKIKPEDSVLLIGNKVASLKSKLKLKKVKILTNEQILKERLLANITFEALKNYYDDDCQIKVIYTKYLSQINFEAVSQTLLPIPKIETTNKTSDIDFEPSKEELFEEILETYLETVLTGLFQEAKVSEFTSRRVAMENASKNGQDMLKELSIEFNRTRQAKITQEIAEIVGGAEALKSN